MQIEGMTSKHFTYYLKKLLNEELIKKVDNRYYLTDKGKDYVARLDEADMNYEKPPKLGVAIFPERLDKHGNKEILVNKRLKQPYYGKVGGFTGKVRFGEDFEKTARRELLEESGLTGDFEMRGMIRKFGYKKAPDKSDKVRIQDQIFIFFTVTNLEGEFISRIKDQKNFWVKYEDLKQRQDLFDSFLDFLERAYAGDGLGEIEVEYEASGY